MFMPVLFANGHAHVHACAHVHAQAFGSLECACGLKAVEYWLRAAEMAYDSSSLMEALRLFQQVCLGCVRIGGAGQVEGPF